MTRHSEILNFRGFFEFDQKFAKDDTVKEQRAMRQRIAHRERPTTGRDDKNEFREKKEHPRHLRHRQEEDTGELLWWDCASFKTIRLEFIVVVMYVTYSSQRPEANKFAVT